MPKTVLLNEVSEGEDVTRLQMLEMRLGEAVLNSRQLFSRMISVRDDRGSQERFSQVEISHIIGGRIPEIRSDVFELMNIVFDKLDHKPLTSDIMLRGKIPPFYEPFEPRKLSASKKPEAGLRVYFNTRVCEHQRGVVSNRLTYGLKNLTHGSEIKAILDHDLSALFDALGERDFLHIGQSVVLHFDITDQDGGALTISLDYSREADESTSRENFGLSLGGINVRIGDARASHRFDITYSEFTNALERCDNILSAELFESLEVFVPPNAYATQDRWRQAKECLSEISLG